MVARLKSQSCLSQSEFLSLCSGLIGVGAHNHGFTQRSFFLNHESMVQVTANEELISDGFLAVWVCVTTCASFHDAHGISEQTACSSPVCFYTSLSATTCSLRSLKKTQGVAERVEASTLLGTWYRDLMRLVSAGQLKQIPDRRFQTILMMDFVLGYVYMFRNISSH